MVQLPFIVGLFLAVLLIAALTLAFAVYTLRILPAQRRQGTALSSRRSAHLPLLFEGFFYWAAMPLANWLARHGVTPNAITTLSLILASLAAFALAGGEFLVAAWLLGAAASCDALDGMLARKFHMSSTSGAFYDSFADRMVEGILYLGLAFYGQGGWLTWTSMAALIGSYAVSYARARGQALGVDCDQGMMQRPERMVLLFVAVLFSPFLALYLEPGREAPVYHLAIWVTGAIAVLSLFTAWNRVRWIIGELQSQENARKAHSHGEHGAHTLSPSLEASK